jgi:hypothetical protein
MSSILLSLLHDDKDSLFQMRMQSRRTFEDRYLLTEMKQRMVSFYQNIVNND